MKILAGEYRHRRTCGTCGAERATNYSLILCTRCGDNSSPTEKVVRPVYRTVWWNPLTWFKVVEWEGPVS